MILEKLKEHRELTAFIQYRVEAYFTAIDAWPSANSPEVLPDTIRTSNNGIPIRDMSWLDFCELDDDFNCWISLKLRHGNYFEDKRYPFPLHILDMGDDTFAGLLSAIIRTRFSKLDENERVAKLDFLVSKMTDCLVEAERVKREIENLKTVYK